MSYMNKLHANGWDSVEEYTEAQKKVRKKSVMRIKKADPKRRELIKKKGR